MKFVALVFVLICSHAWSAVPFNPDMELGGKRSAAGWQTDIRAGEYEFSIAGKAHSGERCLAIEAAQGGEAGWARWYTTDLYLFEGARYAISAWVKAEGDAVGEVWIPGARGGFMKQFSNSPEWSEVVGEFAVPGTGRYGIYLQSKAAGTVFFDDVTVRMIEAPPRTKGSEVPTDGRPIVGIVVPESPEPHHAHLASEIQRILEAMTGKRLTVTPWGPMSNAPSGRSIWVGIAPPGEDYGPHLAQIGEEGIVLDVGPNAIVCLGRTARGVYYAVHEFLRMLDCRWPWPGDLGEIIPERDELHLTENLTVHDPSFTLRGGHIVQVYHTPPDWKPKHVNTEAWVDWAARNRMNRLKASYPQTWNYGAMRGWQWDEYGGHNLYAILPPEQWFDKRPDFYPLVDGKRITKHSSGRHAEICVSAPGLVQVMADFITEYFDGHPHAERFFIGAEDEPSTWCECDGCKALDTKDLDWENNGVRCMDLTDRWLYFINEVARIVEKAYPEKIIATWAYGSTAEIPIKNSPRRNVMIELTWWDRCFKHDVRDRSCEANAKGMERFAAWSELAPVALYRYLDFLHVENPCPYYHAEADLLKNVHAAGCRHLGDEWDTTFASSPLLLNLRARLQWDIDTNVDEFVDDFCNIVYGEAGSVVAKYFRRLERAVAEAPAEHVSFNDLRKFTPEVLAEGHALLDRAEGLAEDDDILARIDRLRYALLFAELDKVTEEAKENAELYARQAEIQDRLWTLVEKRQIEPILGYFGRLGREYRAPVDALSARRIMELPKTWRFKADPENAGERDGWFAKTPDPSWTPISIHEPWEGQGYEGYDGYAWYSVEIRVPSFEASRTWLLFAAVDETFKLWINGEYAGASEGDPGLLWDKNVAVEMTDRLKLEDVNRITLRVHDSAYAGGIWKPVWITGK